MTKPQVTPVLCMYDYLGIGEGRPCWHSDAVMVEVESLDDVREEFDRTMRMRMLQHGTSSVGPRPRSWRLRSVLTPDHVERHH